MYTHNIYNDLCAPDDSEIQTYRMNSSTCTCMWGLLLSLNYNVVKSLISLQCVRVCMYTCKSVSQMV